MALQGKGFRRRHRAAEGALSMVTQWDPKQYHRFQDERAQPFYDLLDLVQPVPGGRVVDLGCGPGELTRVLHERTGAAETIGVDSSESMLAQANGHAGDGLRFELADIANLNDSAGFDIVFSNAALQWLADHATLIPRVASLVRAGGQLAVQVPTNNDHPSHVVAHELAAEEPYRSALGGYARRWPVLPPEWYAETLDRLGFVEQSVRLQVYGHHLAEPAEVVEWVKGTLLTDYKKRMPPELYDRYVADYRERLLAKLEDRRPYFYAFKRVLFWGRKAS
jgi:trans-aconitate 2-methyltransferase